MPNEGKPAIIDISTVFPEQGKKYLFDTNIWLLKLRSPSQLKELEQSYVDFVDGIINLIDNPKAKNKPEIIICSLIISEIFNAFVKIAFEDYKIKLLNDNTNNLTEEQIKNLSFKQDYRGSTDYVLSVRLFKDDFEGFIPYLTLIENNSSVDPFSVLLALSTNLEFNDSFYYNLCKSNNYTFITNDGDFQVEGIEVLTKNRKLLKKG